MNIVSAEHTKSFLGVIDGVAGPNGYTIVTVETSWGSEGYVAVCRETRADLLWLAFFEDSNPFEPETIRIVSNDVFTVNTTYRAEWRFSISDPANIFIKKGEFGW